VNWAERVGIVGRRQDGVPKSPSRWDAFSVMFAACLLAY